MKLLLHPTFFPNIASFQVLVNYEVVWEVQDNYQKQTYRNRCHICTDQGLHKLTIPIKHVGTDQGRQKFKEVEIDYSYDWQKQHWRTLQTAYRTSPFFEFYEDDLKPLFETKTESLLETNFKSVAFICDCLGIATPNEKTTAYEPTPTGLQDARSLVNAKATIDVKQPAYVQVFGDRHGFISNTSMLDLLFNEGPNALNYLKQLTGVL